MKKTGFVLLVLAGVFLLMNTGPGISQAATIHLGASTYEDWAIVSVDDGTYVEQVKYANTSLIEVAAARTGIWATNELEQTWSGDGTSSATLEMRSLFEGGFDHYGTAYAAGYMWAEHSFTISPEFGTTGPVSVDFSAHGVNDTSVTMSYTVKDALGTEIFEWIYDPDDSSTYTQTLDLNYSEVYTIDLAIMTVDGHIVTYDTGDPFDFDFENFAWLDIDTHEVPIPGALWLLGSGLIGLIGLRRKSAG